MKQEPARANALVFAIPLGIMTVAGTTGAAFWAYLLARSPLLLVALSPLFRHIVLASPYVDAVSLFAVAVPRHFLPDPFVYFLGRQYGPVALEWAEANSPFMARVARLIERLFGKVGALVLLASPDIIASTIAGVARVPFPLFVVMNIAGTFITVAVARWFGSALEGPIRAMVTFFQQHLLAVSLGFFALFALGSLASRRRGVPAEGPDEDESEGGT